MARRQGSDINNFDKEKTGRELYKHVNHLSVKIGDRHLWKEHSLDRAAEYIESVLESAKYSVSRQTFTSYGQDVSNLIVEKPGTQNGVIVIGAHYDTVPGSPGADDNASAIAGLLELARLCCDSHIKKRIIFVAFVNEESPCFGSFNMGSMVYAKYLKEQGIPVEIMISLEMIGYFRKDHKQEYPFPGMDLFYPKTADFMAIAGNFQSSKYVTFLKKNIRKSSEINVRSLILPEQAAGISHSDNYSFWKHGYKAVMVTDTAYYRNKNYHQETDTIDKINFVSMTEVVRGLYYSLLQM